MNKTGELFHFVKYIEKGANIGSVTINTYDRSHNPLPLFFKKVNELTDQLCVYLSIVILEAGWVGLRGR